MANNIQAREIFDYLPHSEWQKYVYKGDSNDCWLNSLYVLGGLPINYTSINLNHLYDSIFKAMNGDSEALLSEKNFNSTTFIESLKEGGSLFEFVSSIVEREYPFNKNDIENSEKIKSFIDRVNEGKKRNLSEKFHFDWIVYYDNVSNLAERKLRITLAPEFNGELHSFVSYRRMESDWGIINPKSIPVFKIKCKFDENDVFTIIKFTNQYNGYFTGWLSQGYVDIDNLKIPQSYIDSVKLFVSYKNNSEEKMTLVQDYYNKSHYLQLYKTDQDYVWKSSIKSGDETAVIFRNDLQLANNNLSSKLLLFGREDNVDRYNWCSFNDVCILLNDDGKEIEISRRGCAIEIQPTIKDNTIIYNSGKVRYLSNGIEEYIPLIMGSDGFKVILFEGDSTIEIPQNDYRLLYKTPDSLYYREWDNPNQGLVKLKVEYQGRVSIIDAYYLPGSFKTSIRRNNDKNELCFCPQIKNIKIGNSILSKNTFYDDSKANKYEDTIKCLIGTQEEYVELNIYRPSYRRVLSFNNKPIFVTSDRNKIIEIPIVNSDCMSIHTIDAQGKSATLRQNVGFCDFEEEVSWIKANINLSIIQNNIKYVVGYQSKDFGIEVGKVNVSREFKTEYSFYYWSMRKEDSPIKLNTNYDDENEIMTLEKKYHQKSGIIFQSLKNLDPPKYWLPHINKVKSEYEFKTDNETNIKCIDIAIEHHIYFKMFEPLYSIIQESSGLKDNVIVDLFYNYAQSKNNQITEKEYEGLHRFADEFMFDWLFLQRGAWIDASKRNDVRQALAKKLFRANPKVKNKSQAERVAYSQIVETYWSNLYPRSSDRKKWEPQGRKIDSQAIKFMNSVVDKHEFTGRGRIYETIKNFLHDLYEQDNSFELIYRKIREELFK